MRHKKTTRCLTKSPLALARTAPAVAGQALPAYASKYSKHDFTQHQLFAPLVLRALLKADYRGREALLRDRPDLRQALAPKEVPDHSTRQKAEQRLLEEKGAMPCSPPPSPGRAPAA